MRYAYEVDGRTYEGTRYRYGAWHSSRRGAAEALARRFPVGATVPVFHDAETPEDAVLVAGVQGQELFLLLFMNPFNLAMLAGWYGAVRVLRDEEEELLGAFVRDGRVHVRLDGVGWPAGLPGCPWTVVEHGLFDASGGVPRTSGARWWNAVYAEGGCRWHLSPGHGARVTYVYPEDHAGEHPRLRRGRSPRGVGPAETGWQLRGVDGGCRA
ncbi:MAG TPA: hypothetical protein VEU33_24960 [Archangium sp.]|nr:hypothetical protein [Archangium sp.]